MGKVKVKIIQDKSEYTCTQISNIPMCWESKIGKYVLVYFLLKVGNFPLTTSL